MAAITSEVATAAKAKAHVLAQQPSMKKLAANAAEVPLLKLTSVRIRLSATVLPPVLLT